MKAAFYASMANVFMQFGLLTMPHQASAPPR